VGEWEPTEFERLLKALDGLTRTQLADLVTSRVPRQDAQRFVERASGLSLDALRFVSAHMLLRQQPAAASRR
jgi:hypothetical protein